MTDQPIFRFAPSPNGELHLGHAFSALTNLRHAREAGGKMLLRIEDIDTVRCTPALEAQMLRDLEWIGFEWDEEPIRQSERFGIYGVHADELADAGLLYGSRLSRSNITGIVQEAEAQGQIWPRDPDGSPLFPGRAYEDEECDDRGAALRLDVRDAIAHAGRDLAWTEFGEGPDGEHGDVQASPKAWGDFVLIRKDTPTSYHLACVVDDALQGVTDVVRGVDLFHATSAHVLLQALFGFVTPAYRHHGLLMADDTRKLSKSERDTSLRSLREAGVQPADIWRMIGFAAG